MKKEFSLLLLTGAISLSTSALEMNYSGEFRLRNQNREFTFSNSDRRNLTELRARANFNLKLNEEISFTFTPQVTNNFGQSIAETNDAGDTARNSSGDKYHKGIDIFEAYILSKGDFFSYKIGRQQLNYGDNVVLGRRNWTAGGLTFDSVKLMFEIGEGQLDLAYSKLSEGADPTDANDDSDLTLLYYKILKRDKLELDTYFIRNNVNGTTNLETNTYGVRLKGEWNNITYRTEDILQVHQQTDRNEHNIDLELGYNFDFGLKSYIGWSQSSVAFDHLYTNRHAWNGIIDVVGRRNLETIYAGANYKVSSDWSFKFKWMNFKQKSTGFGAYNQATSAILAGDTSKDDVGNEFDLIASYKKNKYETLKLAASMFSHGDYFTGNIDSSKFFYVEYLLRY